MEEDINKIRNAIIKAEYYGTDITIDVIEVKILKNVLSELERLQKENEELQQEKIDNSKMILLARNSMLDYEKGYNDGKNLRMSAVQSIVENQQYYIIQRKMEKYQNHINMLKKENKELLKNSIPKEKIEGKLEKLANLEHERWAKWQKYVHDLCIKNGDGSLTIPKDRVEHWNYEIETKYKDLPEHLKEYDRQEIRIFLKEILEEEK